MSDKLIVKDLYKVFGKKPKRGVELLNKGKSKEEILRKNNLTVAVNNANFTVKKGEVFVIMGLSGSGKSTLVRCLNRLLDPTAGEVILDGKNISNLNDTELRKVRRKSMSMVFQNFALLPSRTVLSNVEYGLEVQGIEKEEREKKAMTALKQVGLSGYEHNLPSQLSGGMQQRVGLARALANNPDILLMDEAFSALDPLIRSDMQDELLDLQEEMQKTIIFITHDLDEALKIGDRIMLMKDGETVQIGTAEEILSNPANDYVKRFVQGVNRSEILTAEDVMAKPFTTVGGNQGPRVALKEMREHGINSVLVTEKRKLKGVVHIDDVYKAIEQGKKELNGIVKENEVNTVYPDTSIQELIEVTASDSLPTAVVNKENKLLGVVVKGSVLEALIPERGEDNVS
ncbi:glycine betaine/L-proline ABC transporter ATP-binding protein [Proteinivorax hydrogeniformans]|uniref:Quaternary amine transport ATP-binding protein n=1 Tax=Proteinivorax hydrogeniformans TaxID=1826727 RepID=A0AAU8HT60_9FIRM